ncbi:MAG: type II secretion system protein M [Candidatus Binatia bacterium]|nr:type II secretion system protein M [Candidatus Binatia bacterium]
MFDFGSLSRYYDRLAPRERVLLVFAAVATVLILGYTFVWDPLQVSMEQLSRRLSLKEKELAELQREREYYLELLRQLEAYGDISEVDPNFNLLGYLQGVVTAAVSREKIVSLNPTTRPKPEAPEFLEEMVEIKLTQVALPQIVDLLHRVEKGEHPLHFSRVAIKKRMNDPYSFDVQAIVAVLKPAEKPAEKASERPIPAS